MKMVTRERSQSFPWQHTRYTVGSVQIQMHKYVFALHISTA